jgi:hypothetical protein
LLGRSTVTPPPPQRPVGADFSSSAYTGPEVHSVSCYSVDIGGSFREGKAASMSGAIPLPSLCVFMACIRTLLCQTKVYFRMVRILSLEGYRSRRSVLTLVTTFACTIVRTMTLPLFRLQVLHDLKSPCPLFSSSKSV